VLATTNPRRGSGPFGGLPTVAETLPGFELVSWNGILVPAGTPREVVAQLNGVIAIVLEQPEVRKRITDGGFEPGHGTPEAFADTIRRDYAKYEKISRETGMRAQ
jgi:tripartite-type tricarboxylate transporter receptor subunit TctC